MLCNYSGIMADAAADTAITGVVVTEITSAGKPIEVKSYVINESSLFFDFIFIFVSEYKEKYHEKTIDSYHFYWITISF